MQCQDLMNLTYENNTFDLVLSSDIFEHVRKPYIGFKEINRIPKLGGYCARQSLVRGEAM